MQTALSDLNRILQLQEVGKYRALSRSESFEIGDFAKRLFDKHMLEEAACLAEHTSYELEMLELLRKQATLVLAREMITSGQWFVLNTEVSIYNPYQFSLTGNTGLLEHAWKEDDLPALIYSLDALRHAEVLPVEGAGSDSEQLLKYYSAEDKYEGLEVEDSAGLAFADNFLEQNVQAVMNDGGAMARSLLLTIAVLPCRTENSLFLKFLEHYYNFLSLGRHYYSKHPEDMCEFIEGCYHLHKNGGLPGAMQALQNTNLNIWLKLTQFQQRS
jgi:hypothetical protein